MKDEDAAKLLSWLLKYGNKIEAVVHNVELNRNIMVAREKARVIQGAEPCHRIMRMFDKYCRIIDNCAVNEKPAFCLEIEKKYNV